MKRFFSRCIFVLAGIMVPQMAYAHCPLCTLGAGAAVLAATWFGIKSMAVAVFLGAFAAALGFWMGRLLKKEYFKHQTAILVILSYLLTIFPLQPLFHDYASIYISLGGEYGSLLNRTYLIDRFIVGTLIGVAILFLAPSLSCRIQKKIGRRIPFQGILILFLCLILAAFIIQLTV